VRRTVAIGAHEVVEIHGADFPGDVVHDVGVGAALSQRVFVVEITAHDADVAPAQAGRLRRAAYEAGDIVAAPQQRLHQVRADKARSACHKCAHGC